MSRTTSVDGLADAIINELTEYRQEVTDGLKTEIRSVSKDCVKDIKKKAPVLTGDYKKSWSMKAVHESRTDLRIVIFAGKGEYRLAHLLEYGHAKRNGGRVGGKPHIRPAEQEAEKKLLKRVKVLIRGSNS